MESLMADGAERWLLPPAQCQLSQGLGQAAGFPETWRSLILMER